MSHSDVYIDHVILATKSYRQTLTEFTNAGFSIWEMPASPLMRAALIPFKNLGYVEVMAFTGFGRTVLSIVRTLGLERLMLGDYERTIWGRYRPLMGGAKGDNLLVFGVEDLEAFKVAAEARGVAFGDRSDEKGKRVENAPTAWSSYAPMDPGLPPISGDNSDRAVRCPPAPYNDHQNTAISLAGVTYAVVNVETVRDDWQAYLGVAPVRTEIGRLVFPLADDQYIEVVDPRSGQEAAARIAQFGHGLVGVTIDSKANASKTTVISSVEVRVGAQENS